MSTPTPVDVLCVGYACVDINFNAAHHPTADEKLRATSMHTCGGGPAANAAVTIARLGGSARFCGYLGNDAFGEANLREFANDGVHADALHRGDAPTPVAAVTIKPNGERSIIDYRSPSAIAAEDTISLAKFPAKVLLIDGHQPLLSLALIEEARALGIPSILDAGSITTAPNYCTTRSIIWSLPRNLPNTTVAKTIHAPLWRPLMAQPRWSPAPGERTACIGKTNTANTIHPHLTLKRSIPPEPVMPFTAHLRSGSPKGSKPSKICAVPAPLVHSLASKPAPAAHCQHAKPLTRFANR